MAFIHLKDREGQIHQVEAQQGHSLMEIIRNAGFPIEAQCGGCASCATCHVYIESSWLVRLEPQSETEVEMLDLTVELRKNSRLSCQITFSDELNGLTAELAPE